MPRTKITPESLQNDIDSAWGLLHELAKKLQRIAAASAKLNASDDGETRSRPTMARKTSKTRTQKKAAKGLPDTSGAFFLKHVSKRKRTASEIFDSLLSSLDVKPTQEKRAILRNRLMVWLSNATKSDHVPVSSTGTGKERQYYKD